MAAPTNCARRSPHHYGIEAENIVCSNGSDELIALITRAYAGPGDEVLFSRHGFAMYPIATLAVAGATPVMAPETNLTDGCRCDPRSRHRAHADRLRRQPQQSHWQFPADQTSSTACARGCATTCCW